MIPPVAKRLERVNEENLWRLAWVRRHQITGKEIYYKFDIYDPTKGWISKPNLKDVKVFKNQILNTNSKGFRGKKEYSYHKKKNRVRILILGDSFTFGDEVSDNETYSYYLQQMLPKVEIINMGIHGYGHDQMLILLNEEGIKYKPNIVILGFISLDMSRNLLKFRDYAKPKFELKNGRLKLTNSPVPSPEKILKWDWVRPRTFDMFSVFYFELKKLTGLYNKNMEKVTTAILTKMIEVIDSIHATPIFIYLPTADEISNKNNITSGEKYFFSMCRSNDKVKCFSTRPYFLHKISEGKHFKSRGHWGPFGHHTVAEAICRYLLDMRFVSPSK